MSDPVLVEIVASASPAIVEIAVAGPQGPPGADGTSLISRTAGAALSALRVVAANDAGEAVYADTASAASMARILGVTTTAAASGAAVSIQPLGILTDAGWSWTPGAALFVGASGALTATAPTSGTLRQVAVALSATSILVDLRPTVTLG